ncbi:MAG: competence/damage-inducible protein A [Candidatus Cloacimonetes bacterium]|nr:competence/damage-inducible protein A [Candidatus Cloacimonadota bacterium]
MKCSTAVICIGSELLSGRVVNSNLSFLGLELEKIGLPIKYSVIVPDDESSITDSLNDCLKRSNVIITVGGLGPTSDDITKRSIALFLGKPLNFNEEIWSSTNQRFARRGLSTPECNRSQAEVPQDFVVLKNDLGTAPGLYYDHGEQLIIMLPGVPTEMKALFTEKVKPLLVDKYHAKSLIVRTIHTIDIPESQLADMIKDISLPDKVNLAFLSQPGRVDLRISSADEVLINSIFHSLCERCNPNIWGYDEESLPGIIHNLMISGDLKLSIAESCTGGLIQAKLTDIPGASAFFSGGVVTYSDQAKMDLLGVSKVCLEEYGAVSTETAEEMAEGVRKKFKSDIGAAVTGIAGPTGGTEEKPVGMVCFAVSHKKMIKSWKRIFPGNRESIRENATFFLLNLIRQTLITKI